MNTYGQPSDAASNAVAIVLGVAFVVMYLVPVIVAVIHRPRNAAAAIIVGLLLGWTVVGWIVALALACGSKQPRWQPPPPYAGPYQWQPPR